MALNRNVFLFLLLGCQRVDAKKVGFSEIAEKIKQYEIDGLLLIGGFEAFMSLVDLSLFRKQFKEFRIPIICIPATISNNVPGTEFSLGCDTSLNEIVSVSIHFACLFVFYAKKLNIFH